MYRSIIELSTMMNNDEIVVHTEKPLLHEDTKRFARSGWDCPKLVLCRETYDFENLRLGSQGEHRYNKWSDITNMLDAYFKTKDDLLLRKKYFKDMTPTRFLSRWIAYSYYDCMSGGMPMWEVSIARYLCQTEGVDLTERVYPKTVESGEDVWHTLQDFLDCTNDAPDFGVILSQCKSKLPNIFLLESSDGDQEG